MSGMNITRAEAAERSAILAVQHYDIELDLTTGAETFHSATTMRFTCSTPGASTFVDAIAARLESIELNGAPVDLAAWDGFRIALTGLAAENVLRVVGDFRYSHSGEGLHRFVDPVDQNVYTYTQFQVPDARTVYACFEQPDLKATFTFGVTAPAAWTVLNTQPVREVRTEGDARHWAFYETDRMSTYITAIAAGPYVGYHDTYSPADDDGTKTITFGWYARASLGEQLEREAPDLFDLTKRGFAHYEHHFATPYPFGRALSAAEGRPLAKYDQVFVPEFNAGAMENVGLVTYRDQYLFRGTPTAAQVERRAETILHELAHMWFGDLVTMRWWDDLWLNESFATWASVWCQSSSTRWTNSWTTFATTEKLWALRQDQMPSTHPISADAVDLHAVEANFDGITYAKGASVLKQLVAFVGQEAFIAGLQRYFAAHAWGNTELADLFAELEATSGRDLTSWGEAWLQTSGPNTLTPEVEVDAEGRYAAVSIRQTAPAAHPTLRPHRIRVGLYDLDAGHLVRRHQIEIDVPAQAVTEVPALVGLPVADLLLVNDDDLTYAKVRFDPASQATLVASLAVMADPLARALCWTAASDMVRQAELPARDYLRMLYAGMVDITDSGVLGALLATGRSAVEYLADPAVQAELRDGYAERTLAAARAVGASNTRISFVRAWVGAAPAGHAALLQQLLEGGVDGVGLPGLEVDVELRWMVVQRLAALGVFSADDIAREEARDSSAAGARNAEAARAAMPTVAAKTAIFERAIRADGYTNAELEAVVGLWGNGEQAHLLGDLGTRYFAELPAIWATHSHAMIKALVNGLFPRWLIDPATIAAADTWCAEHSDMPSACRWVSEGADDVRRALAAQALDRSSAAPLP